MPLITVGVIAYNVEKYIEDCLESVINQTFSDWECIIVNDGSTDNTLELCAKYAEKDRRIRVISKENGGTSTTRNSIIESAAGEYIFFVDSDDTLPYDALEQCIKGGEDCDVIIGGFNVLSEKGKTLNRIVPEDNIIAIHDFLDSTLKRSIYSAVWGRMFKTDTIRDTRFNCRLREGQDIFFNVNYLLNLINTPIRIKTIGSTVYNYYIRSSSVTHKSNDTRVRKLKILAGEFEKLYENYKDTIDQSCLNSFVLNILWFCRQHYNLQGLIKKTDPFFKGLMLRWVNKGHLDDSEIKDIKFILNHTQHVANIYLFQRYFWSSVKAKIKKALNR